MTGITVGRLTFTLAWRQGSPKPYLTVAGHPYALESQVNRGDLAELARWAQSTLEKGLHDGFRNEFRVVQEEASNK